MKPWIASLAVLFVGAALLVAAVVPGPPLEITYSYSTDATLLESLIQKFNDQHQTVGDHRIHVTGEKKSSGDEMLALVAGAARPTVWTPASQVWGGAARGTHVRRSPTEPGLRREHT